MFQYTDPIPQWAKRRRYNVETTSDVSRNDVVKMLKCKSFWRGLQDVVTTSLNDVDEKSTLIPR